MMRDHWTVTVEDRRPVAYLTLARGSVYHLRALHEVTAFLATPRPVAFDGLLDGWAQVTGRAPERRAASPSPQATVAEILTMTRASQEGT
jgi:hypothetical protein